MSNSGSSDASTTTASTAAFTAGSSIVDLAEVRAARSRTASAADATRVAGDDLFEGIERQAWIVGTAAELMISGMNRFIDELDVLMSEVKVAKEFCSACQEACELEDLDAMIEARDRLRAEFNSRSTSAAGLAAE
ncbi:hypothetical protein GGE65_004201 [Skermanella aerolata]|uniref:hypothetical protein n=1 Tax=Skermanella aerolata TaxID=393310 RepID=UPI003D258200